MLGVMIGLSIVPLYEGLTFHEVRRDTENEFFFFLRSSKGLWDVDGGLGHVVCVNVLLWSAVCARGAKLCCRRAQSVM